MTKIGMLAAVYDIMIKVNGNMEYCRILQCPWIIAGTCSDFLQMLLQSILVDEQTLGGLCNRTIFFIEQFEQIYGTGQFAASEIPEDFMNILEFGGIWYFVCKKLQVEFLIKSDGAFLDAQAGLQSFSSLYIGAMHI